MPRYQFAPPIRNHFRGIQENPGGRKDLTFKDLMPVSLHNELGLRTARFIDSGAEDVYILKAFMAYLDA